MFFTTIGVDVVNFKAVWGLDCCGVYNVLLVNGRLFAEAKVVHGQALGESGFATFRSSTETKIREQALDFYFSFAT